jgi:hypothetical protein
VQETMSLQRIRLAPLQPPLADGIPSHSSDDLPSEFCDARVENHRFMDERPSSASSTAAHVRSRRSRGRLTTSRPGWETWA